MIEGQTILSIREVNSYQSEEIRSMKDRIRLLETQEFPFVRHRDFDAKGDLIVGSADNTYNNLTVGANDTILIADSAQTLGVKWGTLATAGITDASITNAKLANMAQATVKGRASAAGTGVPVDLTSTQLNTIIGLSDLNMTTGVISIASTATAQIQMGLASFYLGAVSNTDPLINLDVNDYILYTRSSNTFDVIIGSASKLKVASTQIDLTAATINLAGGVIMTNGMYVPRNASFGYAAQFAGTTYAMSIHDGANENSYLRPGKAAGKAIVGDVGAGIDIGGASIPTAVLGAATVAKSLGVTEETTLSKGAAISRSSNFGYTLGLTGTTYSMTVHNGANEDTYIRPGKAAGTVVIGDVGTSVAIGAAAIPVTVGGDLTVGDDLYVTDTLAVGISTPDSKAHIHEASAGSVSAPASTVLTLERNGDLGLSMLVPADSVQRIYFGDADDNDINQFNCYHLSNDFRWRLDNTDRIRLSSSENSLQPASDAGQSLGSSSFRWNEVWAADGSINTSDEREKRSVKPSDLGLDFITRLQPISWVWSDKPAYEIEEEPGDKQIIPARTYKRPHYGLGAQQVRKVLDDLGVDDFAGYIHDAKTDVYALRYTEFIAPLIMAVQELAEKVERLENGPSKTR